jgi:RNA polymerase sigma factor (sigma-70 family)
MAQLPTNSLLEYIHGLVAEADVERRTDRALLHRFAARHDERAFKVILRRHGPMVLRVCQRLLKRREDAEDVFQATFLVLARKAGSVNWSASVGNWLYGVAHRLAQEARRKQFGRQAHEAATPPPKTAQDPFAEVTGRELVSILDEELANLPGRYRAPLLLHLEGKRDDEAAHDLGYSLSTFKRRLQYARQLLERRLSNRGFVLSAAPTALLLYSAASAPVPPALVATTVQAAALVAAGRSLTAGLVSAEAVALAGSLTHALLVTKLKMAVVAVVVACVLAAGGWGLARQRAKQSIVGAEPSKAEDAHDQVAWNRRNDPVAATIETTLHTAPGQIKQYAFDGNSNTYFASAEDAGPKDHFTLVFEQPVTVHSLQVQTGRPHGDDPLDAGALEVSEDGKTFEPVAAFIDQPARGQSSWECPTGGRQLRAVRVRPAASLSHPLVIREFTVESDPPVAIYKYPVEFVIDVRDAPEMKKWAEKAARICERAYPMINEELKSEPSGARKDGATIRAKRGTVITMSLKNDYSGIVEVENHRIIGSATYFKAHPEDIGAIVYSTANCVQDQCGLANLSPLAQALDELVRVLRREPAPLQLLHLDWVPFLGLSELTRGTAAPKEYSRRHMWLVMGIADYVRFFKYEPGKLQLQNGDKARYNASSRGTAAFLAFLTDKYDREIVRKLNHLLGEGKYRDEVLQELTGKALPQLDEEWRASLRQVAAK